MSVILLLLIALVGSIIIALLSQKYRWSVEREILACAAGGVLAGIIVGVLTR